MAVASVYPSPALTLARAERLEQRAWDRYDRRRMAFNRVQRRIQLAQGPIYWHGIPRERWPQLLDNRPALRVLEQEAWEAWMACLRLYRAVVAHPPHNTVPQFNHEQCAVYGHCHCLDYGTSTWTMCCRCSETRYSAQERGEPWNDAPPTRELVIKDGHTALLDASDYRWLSRYKWHKCYGYTVRHAHRPEVAATHGRDSLLYMHKLIAGLGSETAVDHWNLNRMDNRRSNLRPCTSKQNAINRAGTGRSGYKGVTLHKGRYIARIGIEGRMCHLGMFDTAEDAAQAYNAAALAHYGEFAWLNPLPDAAVTA